VVEKISFTGQVALVTGAGRGMGRSHVLDLAGRGAAVVVNDLNQDNVDAVVAEVTESGGRAVGSCASVATPEGGQAIVDIAMDSFGRVDVLVHNAGIMRSANFEDLTMSQIEDVLSVHVNGAFNVGQPAYRAMLGRGYGRIVLISSTAGVIGLAGATNYDAAKAGLFGLSNGLALEGRDKGVLTNCVLPYSVSKINENDHVPGVDASRHKILEQRRLPESVTALVTFLASKANSATGQVYSACAGRYARVFVGVAPGWIAPDVASVAAEDLSDHFEEIDAHGYKGCVPSSVDDEMDVVIDQLRTRGLLDPVAQ
jgi:NAD(P)-dependent dehydrogenase (short-subunit alcohol dehydrogenase family)